MPPLPPERRTVALFGASVKGRHDLQMLRARGEVDIVCFFDNNPALWGTDVDGIPVRKVDTDACAKVDVIVISSMAVEPIFHQLARLGAAAKAAVSLADLRRRFLVTADSAAAVAGLVEPTAPDATFAGEIEPDPWVERQLELFRSRDQRRGHPSRFEDFALCTICSNNYLAHARVLAASFLRHHPGARVFICLVDERLPQVEYPDAIDDRIIVVEANALGLESFASMAFGYDVLELNTAVKPAFLRYLFDQYPIERLVYLDPDIVVFAPLAPVTNALAQHAIALVPHFRSPIADESSPSEIDILKAGIFNLGFLGLSRRPEAMRLLDWWAARLERHCVREPHRGLFVDQRWMDLVPALYDDYVVLKDPGCNVAYFNLHERTVVIDGDDVRVDGGPLYFFHYSGFDPRRPGDVSRYQTRVRLEDSATLRRLFELYRSLVMDNGYATVSALPYHYATFDSGAAITDDIRKIYRKSADLAVRFPDAFATSDHSFLAWLNERAWAGSDVTNLLAGLHSNSEELRHMFPDIRGADGETYLQYMVKAAVPLYGLPSTFLDPLVSNERVDRLRSSDLQSSRRATVGADELPVGVNVAGYIDTESGVGELVRGSIRALTHIGVPVALNNVSQPWLRREDRTYVSFASGNPYRVNLVHVNADQVDAFTEQARERYFEGRYNIGYWVWELAEFPRRWDDAFRSFDEIWVSSDFNLDALARVSPVPVVKVPPPIRVRGTGALGREHFGIRDDACVFLFICDGRSFLERKNPLAVLRAFALAFADGRPLERPVELVLKCSNLDADPVLAARVRALAQHLPVRIIDGYLEGAAVGDLMRACDCYVSLHRAEGFGLTIAEAMLLGKPVVTTAYSGPVDFATVNNSYLVPYQLVELGADCGPYPRGSVWADPDVERAATLLRQVYDDPAAAARLGAAAADTIAVNHAPEATAARMAARLERTPGWHVQPVRSCAPAAA